MTVVRVKTATGWQDLQLMGPTGPAGPQGPAGTPAPFPPADLNKPAINYSIGGGESGNFTTALEFDSGMRHTITPSVNVWWLVEFWTLVYMVDAAWGLMDGLIDLAVSPTTPDALGKANWRSRVPGHNAFSYRGIHTAAMLKLSSALTYTIRCVLVPIGGTWRWYRDPLYSYSISRVVGYW